MSKTYKAILLNTISTGYIVFKKGSFLYLVKRIILSSGKLMNITVNVLSYKIQKQNLQVCIWCICMLHIYELFMIIYVFLKISFEILKY